MGYLRLAPAEYRDISRICRQLDLGRCARPAFRSRLIAALAGAGNPLLARKIARLHRPALRVLHQHFQAPVKIQPERSTHAGLTPEEWESFAEACVSYPLPIRFIRPFRHMLVELFRDVSPELARKLESLSGLQFEHLYGQVKEQRWGTA